MVRKIYTSKSFFYSTYVVIDGKNVTITFKGGSNMIRGNNGTFSTSDKTMQDAIEALPEFKNGFITIKSTYETSEPKSNDTSIKIGTVSTKKAEKVKKEVVEEVSEDTTDMKEVKSADTKQKAARYLNTEFGVPYTSISTIDNIIKVGKEYNVCFPNLK